MDPSIVSSFKFEEITAGFFGAPAKLKELLPKDWKNNAQGFNKFLETKFKESLNF